MDWVAVYENHTPYEWKMQQAREMVDPIGEDRADMRAAFNTFAAMRSDNPELLRLLMSYLPFRQTEQAAGPASMRQLIEG